MTMIRSTIAAFRRRLEEAKAKNERLIRVDALSDKFPRLRAPASVDCVTSNGYSLLREGGKEPSYATFKGYVVESDNNGNRWHLMNADASVALIYDFTSPEITARAILADAWKRVQALGFTINYNRDPGGSMAGDVESEIVQSASISLRKRLK